MKFGLTHDQAEQLPILVCLPWQGFSDASLLTLLRFTSVASLTFISNYIKQSNSLIVELDSVPFKLYRALQHYKISMHKSHFLNQINAACSLHVSTCHLPIIPSSCAMNIISFLVSISLSVGSKIQKNKTENNKA